MRPASKEDAAHVSCVHLGGSAGAPAALVLISRVDGALLADGKREQGGPLTGASVEASGRRESAPSLLCAARGAGCTRDPAHARRTTRALDAHVLEVAARPYTYDKVFTHFSKS